MKRRGTSNLLAALLLFAIVAAAVTVMTSTINDRMKTGQQEISVEKIDMQLTMIDPGDKAYLIFDIKNTGNIPVSNATMWFEDDAGSMIKFEQLDLFPGVHWENRGVIDATLSAMQYNVSIEAVGIDGSEFATIVVVHAT